MHKEISTFGNIKIEKNKIIIKTKIKIYQHRTPIFFKYVDVEKILVSKKISFSEKTIGTLLVTYIRITKLSHYI